MSGKLQESRMIGQTWQSEIREFKDAKTGRTLQQLTSTGNNVHLYFTENSFDAHKNEIIFLSDRASGEDKSPHENPHYNLFRMNLDTGEIGQLTDEPPRGEDEDSHAGPVGSVTKTPDSRLVVYRTGNRLKKLDTATGQTTVIYAETGSYNLGAPSIARNRRYIAFCRNEDVHVADGPNYTGFKDRYYLVKDWRITL
ncbi:MAG: hypothetical protein FJ026_06270, partial [Chloroflexi bacterium]|nr:hypothetical protein [Chloroflexota bacterium]